MRLSIFTRNGSIWSGVEARLAQRVLAPPRPGPALASAPARPFFSLFRKDSPNSKLPFAPDLLELSICPLTKATLAFNPATSGSSSCSLRCLASPSAHFKTELINKDFGIAYSVSAEGIPNFLLDQARRLTEDELHRIVASGELIFPPPRPATTSAPPPPPASTPS